MVFGPHLLSHGSPAALSRSAAVKRRCRSRRPADPRRGRRANVFDRFEPYRFWFFRRESGHDRPNTSTSNRASGSAVFWLRPVSLRDCRGYTPGHRAASGASSTAARELLRGWHEFFDQSRRCTRSPRSVAVDGSTTPCPLRDGRESSVPLALVRVAGGGERRSARATIGSSRMAQAIWRASWTTASPSALDSCSRPGVDPPPLPAFRGRWTSSPIGSRTKPGSARSRGHPHSVHVRAITPDASRSVDRPRARCRALDLELEDRRAAGDRARVDEVERSRWASRPSTSVTSATRCRHWFEELRPDQVLGVPRVGDLEERPAAEAAPVVDGDGPEVLGGGDLGLLLLLGLAGDLQDEGEEVVRRPVDAGSRRRIRKSGT